MQTRGPPRALDAPRGNMTNMNVHQGYLCVHDDKGVHIHVHMFMFMFIFTDVTKYYYLLTLDILQLLPTLTIFVNLTISHRPWWGPKGPKG